MNFDKLTWPLLLVSGLFNTVGWVGFVVGKRREELLRMVWGVALFATSIVFADSWLWLLVSGIGFTALMVFKPE